MLDDMMFTYVKNDKEKMKKRFNMTDDELSDQYKNVDDTDVLIH
jgi:hypothetical protein